MQKKRPPCLRMTVRLALKNGEVITTVVLRTTAGIHRNFGLTGHRADILRRMHHTLCTLGFHQWSGQISRN